MMIHEKGTPVTTSIAIPLRTYRTRTLAGCRTTMCESEKWPGRSTIWPNTNARPKMSATKNVSTTKSSQSGTVNSQLWISLINAVSISPADGMNLSNNASTAIAKQVFTCVSRIRITLMNLFLLQVMFQSFHTIHHTAVHTARNLPKSDVYLTCQYLGSSDDI